MLAAAAAECPLDLYADHVWELIHSRLIAGGDGASATAPTGQAAPASDTGDLQATAEQRKTAAEAALQFLGDGEKRERYEVLEALRPVTTSVSTVKGALKKLVDTGLVAHPADKGPYWITETGRAELADREHVA